MDDSLQVIAEFETEAEARIALALLQDEGIQGDVRLGSPNLRSIVAESLEQSLYAVAVPPSDVERSRQLLSAQGRPELEAGWEEEAEHAIDGWICPNCDTQVSAEEAFCPECGASRTDVRADDDESAD